MSLVGFRAKNHPQQAVRDDVDDRRTPREFFDPLHAERRFTIDVAASHANALLPRYWTRYDDGLAMDWTGERVWCNPPYSSLAVWAEKADLEFFDGRCGHITMLLPANRCEQAWWQDYIEPHRDRAPYLTTQFLRGRMRFDWPGTRVTPAKGDRPPFGLVLVTWERRA